MHDLSSPTTTYYDPWDYTIRDKLPKYTYKLKVLLKHSIFPTIGVGVKRLLLGFHVGPGSV